MEGEPPKPNQYENPSSPESAQEPELVPRIYVADLAAYNDGQLHGTWIDAAQEPELLQQDIDEMLARSPKPHAGDWAIHDFSGFNGLHLGEWENLDYVSRVAKGITEHGLAYAHWATLVSSDEELDEFPERYLGQFDSLGAYVDDLVGDLGVMDELDRVVSEPLRPYVTFDSEAFGRDLVLGGDIAIAESEQGGVYVYRSL